MSTEWRSARACIVSIARSAAVLAPLLCLISCTKTVQWKEEVPLNTGTVVWVQRSIAYTLRGGAGNPLDIQYRPAFEERIEFDWKGRHYVYQGDARVMLLAISPGGHPVLVARAADNSWDYSHGYECTHPYYVQLNAADSRQWTWPRAIEPWLYELPANLMLQKFDYREMKSTVSARDREFLDRPASATERLYSVRIRAIAAIVASGGDHGPVNGNPRGMRATVPVCVQRLR